MAALAKRAWAWLTTPSPARERLLLIGSAIGWGIGLAAFIQLVTLPSTNGGLGYDAHSYWLAGRNVLDGKPLYWPVTIDAYGPYRYPPLFAQLWAPFALLPEVAFHWLWRLVCFGSLWYLAGSLRNVGLWLLVPFTITELAAANVTFPIAAATLLAFRRDVRLLPWAAALKFGPLLAVPFLWFCRPGSRRPLVASTVILIAALAASFAISPDSWWLYAESLGWQGASASLGDGLLSLLPSAGADFALRLAIAGAMTAVAATRGLAWLAYASTVVATPTLWVQRLTVLLATPRAGGRDDRSTDDE